jgi:hypothetical protein
MLIFERFQMQVDCTPDILQGFLLRSALTEDAHL